jgi:protein-S-isoprenylcysteine O-methyltransferase Ste14
MSKKIFLIAAIICIITHIVRFIYEIMKHKKLLKASKLSFVIIFTNMCLLWASWFTLCANDMQRIELPAIISYLGIFIAGIGLVIFIVALATIKSLESYEGDLITKGIYSITRHPMYLSFILWLIGMPVFYGALYALILSLPFIINVLFWRYLEEKELLERFSTYIDYKKKTIF